MKYELRKFGEQVQLHINTKIHSLKLEEYNNCLLESKKAYYNNAVLGCANDQGALFNVVNGLLHKTYPPPAFYYSTITAHQRLY